MRLQMIRPKLVFLTAPHPPAHMDDSASVDLFLRNVGDGVALNVLVQRSEDNKFKLRFEPEHIPILQKQEQVLLTIRPAEGHYQPDMKLILNDRSISLKIVARYVDVAPEAAVGGPIAALRERDTVVFDVERRTLSVELSAAELAIRQFDKDPSLSLYLARRFLPPRLS